MLASNYFLFSEPFSCDNIKGENWTCKAWTTFSWLSRTWSTSFNPVASDRQLGGDHGEEGDGDDDEESSSSKTNSSHTWSTSQLKASLLTEFTWCEENYNFHADVLVVVNLENGDDYQKVYLFISSTQFQSTYIECKVQKLILSDTIMWYHMTTITLTITSLQ